MAAQTVEHWLQCCRRVFAVQKRLNVGFLFKEQHRLTASRIGKRQRQLHFPVNGAGGFHPASGMTKAVRPNLQPRVLTQRCPLVNIESTKGRLLFTCFTCFGGQLAAWVSQYPLE